jgi:predicted Zn-dependent protease
VRAGRYDSAITFLEEAMKPLVSELDKKDIRGAITVVLLQKAKKADKDGRGAEAETSLKKAVALEPGNVQYLIALARLRHKAGSLAEAEELLRQGLKRFEDEPSRQEILAARDKMRQTEAILKKISETES